MDGAFGLILNTEKEKVLLVKRRDIPIWVLPGGGIESGEIPEQAVIREVFEETGFKVEIINKVGEYYLKKKKRTNHTYTCQIIGGNKTLSKESKEIEYFKVDHLPDMIAPFVPLMIKDALITHNEVVIKKLGMFPLSMWFKALFHPLALFKYLLTLLGIHWNT